ncbi:MAG: hypothetical protein IIY19_03935, partial [Lachnospiraceae bacterium]|nr:hypothetical protein [Lachnospiraceae bacterium]
MKLKLKLYEILSITMVAVVILAGLCFMGTREVVAKEKSVATVNSVLMQETSLPNAGIGRIVNNYVGATGESSVDLLSTTALGATYTEYNEYYDSKGGSLGKLIVCNVDESIAVYDRIPGNERIERGDTQMAQITGRMSKGDVATLVGVYGNWYQIVADDFSGFANTSFFAVGKDAEALDASTWMRIAVVNDDELMLNVEPDYNSDLLAFLYTGLW